MPEILEHHEIRVHGSTSTIVFVANSEDGRLTIRQERNGGQTKDVCAISLADADELRAFFKGLRRTLASLGHPVTSAEDARQANSRTLPASTDDERDVAAQASQRNPQTFAPWTKREELEIIAEQREGKSIDAIARAHKRSPRAIELRLQRLGVLPTDG
jgi:hypothetical protein